MLLFSHYYCRYYFGIGVDVVSLVGMLLPFPFLPYVGWSFDTKFSTTKGKFF
jgi:hypothetical protein